MGRMKDYMIDNALNAQRWVSTVQFTCPVCGHVNQQDVDVPEPNYMAEKSSEMTSEGEAELFCEGCEKWFSADVWAGPAHCDMTIREYEGTHVSCDSPGYDRPPEEWLDDWEVPEHPKDVFDLNADELREIIKAQASDFGGALINRMIFAQILTFLEAYFCDNLIKGLREHPSLLVSFSEKDGAIKDASIAASSVLRDPNAVQNWIEYNLKNRLYHQFGSGKKDKAGKEKPEGVVLWYAMAFGFRLTPSDADLAALRDYATLRHDCVHRNGETKDGEKLVQFDKAYLQDALKTAVRIVAHIDKEMQALRKTE